MLSSLYRYLRVHGVRQTASAAWQALRRHAYIEERLIVIVKDLDSIVEPGRPTELRLEDLAAEHLSELSDSTAGAGGRISTAASPATSSRAFMASSPTAVRSWLARLVGRPRRAHAVSGSAQAGARDRARRIVSGPISSCSRSIAAAGSRRSSLPGRELAARSRLQANLGLRGQQQPPGPLDLQFAGIRADVDSQQAESPYPAAYESRDLVILG